MGGREVGGGKINDGDEDRRESGGGGGGEDGVLLSERVETFFVLLSTMKTS